MSVVRSFPPIARSDARVLVLGSMPGIASLQAGQYYAHARNAFWSIMGELFGFDPRAPYPLRQEALHAVGVAVWDVLQSCVRAGSLDSMIETDTEVPNDFAAFFAAHRRISHVFFNGATAEACFRRHVLPAMPHAAIHAIQLARLPSTSPANASWPLSRKQAAWAVLTAALASQ